jgi:hypothetical protein
MINELLIIAIVFLPCEYGLICKRVCKTWLDNSKSNLVKKNINTNIKKNMLCKII